MLDGMNSDSLDNSSLKHRQGCLAQPVQNMTGSKNLKNESYNKGRMEEGVYLRNVVGFFIKLLLFFLFFFYNWIDAK